MKLRGYQENAIAANKAYYDRGYWSVLNHLATGLGKTAIAIGATMELFNPQDYRTLFMVHTEDIVRQTRKSYLEWHPELRRRDWTKFGRPGIGMVMNKHDDVYARIIVGTPQTLGTADEEVPNKRLARILENGPIDFLICDEGHHAVSKTQMSVVNALKAANPSLKVLGLTATPLRQDGLGLHNLYQMMSVKYTIPWGIKHGFLCPILPPLEIKTNLTLPDKFYGKAHLTQDDEEEIARTIDVDNWAELLHKTYMERGEGRPGIWFMPSVEHSRTFTRYMQSQGITCAHIDGAGCIDEHGLDSQDREGIIERYIEGDIDHLANYNVLTEGFDAPRCSLIGWSRNTTSESLLTQAVGRGTRLHPSKQDLLVLDFAVKGIGLLVQGTLEGHGWNVDTKPVEDESELEIDQLTEGLDLRDLPSETQQVVNGNGVVVKVGSLFRRNKEAWYADVDSVMSLSCSDTATLVIVPPHYTLAAKLRHALDVVDEKLLANPDSAKLLDQVERLTKAHTYFANFTLWQINGHKYENGAGFVKVRWDEPEMVATEETVEYLFEMAAPIQDEILDPGLAKKHKKWRKDGVSDKQKYYLKSLGCTDEPENKGEAAQLITHWKAAPEVLKIIEKARRACGPHGELNIDSKAS